MNEIVNKFLLAGDKLMPEMHLKQPGFIYSACGPFTKNKERAQQFKELGDASYIYKNKLDKACFQHDMAYGNFKDLSRRAALIKMIIFRNKAFNIAKSPKYDGYQRGLTSVVYKFFDKKSKEGAVANNKVKQNRRPFDLASLQLAEELHKPIIRTFKRNSLFEI